MQKKRGKFYAGRSVGQGKQKRILLMARVILGLTDPKVQAEHKNGDTLDNRRENLRPATNAQNQANTGPRVTNVAGTKGVGYNAKQRSPRKWRARISVGRKNVHLGWFLTKEEAVEAYRQKAVELYGEFVPVCPSCVAELK